VPVDPRGNALIPTPGDEPDDANQFDPDGNQHELRSQFADPGRGFDGINEILKRLYRANICHRMNVHYLCGNSWEDIQEFLEDTYQPLCDRLTTLCNGNLSLAASLLNTVPNIYAGGTPTYGIAVGADFVSIVMGGASKLLVGADGKVTIPGLLDPTGLEMTPVGANPGGTAANTLWADSGAGNRFKVGTNTLAYLSEVGTGDVAGPVNSVDNELARFDSTTGKIIKGGTSVIADNGTLAATLRTPHVAGGSLPINLKTGDASAGNSGNLTADVGSASGTHGAISIGTGNAESVAIGRSGKNTAIGGTLSSGGHTLSKAATASATEATATSHAFVGALSGSDVRRRAYPMRVSLTSATTVFSFALGAGENVYFHARFLVKRTDSGSQSMWVEYSWVAENIGGTVTITAHKTESAGVLTLGSAPTLAATKGGSPILFTIQTPAAGTEVWNGIVEIWGPLAS
jgi:hypothetical protein